MLTKDRTGAHDTRQQPDGPRATAPLRRVESVTVSEDSGQTLNPHYFWLTWEYTLSLECGHSQVRARCVFDRDTRPENLEPPLPKRVRCTDCPRVPMRARTPGRRKPDPAFDPVVGNLVRAMCKAAPERQDSLLRWVNRFGRYVSDDPRRCRGYAAIALTAIDTYLVDTDNPHARAIRSALESWSQAPTGESLAAIRQTAQRLYGSQRRGGSWYAHRGILEAAKIASHYPHNVAGALSAPTWDAATRGNFYGKLRAMRDQYDDARHSEAAAFLADDGDSVRAHNGQAEALWTEIGSAILTDYPTLEKQHMELADAMLSAYEVASASEARKGDPPIMSNHDDAEAIRYAEAAST